MKSFVRHILFCFFFYYKGIRTLHHNSFLAHQSAHDRETVKKEKRKENVLGKTVTIFPSFDIFLRNESWEKKLWKNCGPQCIETVNRRR